MSISDARPLKIVVVGDSKVGKTTLIHNYLEQTLGRLSTQKQQLDYQIIQVQIQQNEYCVAIWDAVGLELQNQMNRFLVKDAHVVMLCIDLSKYILIQSIYTMMDTLISYCHEQCQFVLVGTKQDLNSQNTQILNQFFLELQQKYQNLKLLLTVSTYNEDSIKQAFQKTFELGASLDKSSITILQSFILQRNENYSVLKKCSDRESKVQKHENCC